jgi:hypothetical protein
MDMLAWAWKAAMSASDGGGPSGVGVDGLGPPPAGGRTAMVRVAWKS